MAVGKQASRIGNSGRPEKRQAFIADKAAKQATASEITAAIGARSQAPKVPSINNQPKQGQVSPDTNKGRGPRKGNK